MLPQHRKEQQQLLLVVEGSNIKLLTEYYKEIYDSEVITDGKTYFIIYNMYDDGSLFVRLTFISKEARGKRSLTRIEQEVIEKEKPVSIWCEIEKRNKNWDRIAHTYIRRQGYKIADINEERVKLYREISYE